MSSQRSRFRFSLLTLVLVSVIAGTWIAFVVKLPGIAKWAYRNWEVGQQFDERIFASSRFSVRVRAFHERGTVKAAPGCFYQYEVKKKSDRRWREITTSRLPSPTAIPSDEIQRIADDCAFFYNDQQIGVTTDAGSTWTLHTYYYIENVSIDRSGRGELTLLTQDAAWNARRHTLTSSDFGRSWHEE